MREVGAGLLVSNSARDLSIDLSMGYGSAVVIKFVASLWDDGWKLETPKAVIRCWTASVVLRPASVGRHRILGEAYVHKVMDGQLMDTDPEMETSHIC
jgi:hypothetical protein